MLKLAADFIRVDRGVIFGIDLDPVRRSLVASLVRFASETGAEVLAEGVETADELDAVRTLGVRYAQGYFLGRPAPFDVLELSRAVPIAHPTAPVGSGDAARRRGRTNPGGHRPS